MVEQTLVIVDLHAVITLPCQMSVVLRKGESVLSMQSVHISVS